MFVDGFTLPFHRLLAATWRRVRGRRETVTRGYVSVVAEIELHGMNSQTATFNLVGTCVRTNPPIQRDPRVKATPKLEHQLKMHVPSELRRS